MTAPCPLGACEHPVFSHDWEEPGVRPMCCVDGCGCGKSTPETSSGSRLCPACALADRTESRLYHARCSGPDRCDCTHDALKEVLFRG